MSVYVHVCLYVYVLMCIKWTCDMTLPGMCVDRTHPPISLISWTKKVHVDGQQQVELLPLLEQCTKEIADNHLDLYRDDLRYLRVWMQVRKIPHDDASVHDSEKCVCAYQ